MEISLTELHDVVTKALRAYGIASWARTPSCVVDPVIVLEAQEIDPRATEEGIMYVLSVIRESKSLKNPGRS